ncbi:MAG: hypothetical protein AAB521_01485 [Patescibacteria group bacterium]
MSKTKFFYYPEDHIDPNTKKTTTIFKPLIPIRLQGSKLAKIPVDCLLDSGSDTNLFPAGWGEAAGIKINKGEPKDIFGIGGVIVPAFRHPVVLWVGTKKFTTQADFSVVHNTPILGRMDFFKFFPEVIFNEIKRYVEIEL